MSKIAVMVCMTQLPRQPTTISIGEYELAVDRQVMAWARTHVGVGTGICSPGANCHQSGINQQIPEVASARFAAV